MVNDQKGSRDPKSIKYTGYPLDRFMLRAGVAVLICFGVVLEAGRAGNWPGWRGPTGLGYTDENDLVLTWDAKSGQNILWKTLLHGGSKKNPEFSSPGWSSPIVWGDRVFLTTSVWAAELTEKERRATIAAQHVLCFQVTDGKLLWDTLVPSGKCLVNNFYHGYTVPTPVTDGEYVFALFGSGIIAALDFDGKIIWQEELPRLRDVDGGLCSSPILYDDTVIIPSIADAGLRALNKATGKVKWQQQSRDRNTMSTPALIRIKGSMQLIHYAGGIQALDPGTGELIWFCRGVTSGQSSPMFASGLLYTDAGRGGQFANVVDATGTADVSKTHVKWKAKASTAAGSSAIVIGDYIYRSCDPGLIRCRELATGEIIYEERTAKICPGASPIACPDGRIYFASPSRSYVIKAGSKFELLASNDLDDGHYTTPAVSAGRLFIKGKSYLWCIGKK
jgi:outer membrane protein assembly factor BamB